MDSPGSRFEDGANWPVGGASETASTSPLRCAASISLCPPPTVADSLPACYFLYASTFVTPSLTPEEDARGLSDDFEPGILVLSVFLSDRVLSFVSDLLKDGYDPRSGPCCPALGVCDPLVSVSFDCWLPIVTSDPLSQNLFNELSLFSSLGRNRLQISRLGMEAVVACSARGLDLQCWRRPVFVLLPACQRCDDNADIDDTFGGVRSAGDGSVNERAGLAVQRRWGVSDAERTAVGLERRYWMIRAGMLGLSAGTLQHVQDSSRCLLMDVYERSCDTQRELGASKPGPKTRYGVWASHTINLSPYAHRTTFEQHMPYTARYAVIILGATHIPSLPEFSSDARLFHATERYPVIAILTAVDPHHTCLDLASNPVVSFAFSKASSSVLNEAMTTKGPKTSSRNTRISDLTFVKTVGLTKNPLPLPTFLYASPPMARVAPSLLPASILVQISIVKDKQRRFAASLKGNVLHVHGRRLHDFLARSG
ncbi:hypothetical protein KC360_g128 [Hortaea werneckii]|nr:hypothetical protein KC360_g128 [Hortaea werneckii]